MEQDEVYRMLYPNYRKGIIRTIIITIFELPLAIGMIPAFVIYLMEKDIGIMLVTLIMEFLMVFLLYLRIDLLIRGIKVIYFLKKGKLIEADLIYFKWKIDSRIITVKYTYIQQGGKYTKKERRRYLQDNYHKFHYYDIDETKEWQENARIPILVYKKQSCVLFYSIGIYDEFYFGKEVATDISRRF